MKKLKDWVDRIDLPINAKVLDAGCGTGYFANHLADWGYNAYGVDISEKAIQRAKSLYPNVCFKVSSLESKWPYRNRTFSLIWCSEVMEHIFDVEFMVQEMKRVLKSRGYAIITTPYHGFLKNLMIVLLNFEGHFNVRGQHIRFFSTKALKSLLQQNGFSILSCNGYGRVWPFYKSTFVVCKKNE